MSRLSTSTILADLLDYADGRDGRPLDRDGHNDQLVYDWFGTPRGRELLGAIAESRPEPPSPDQPPHEIAWRGDRRFCTADGEPWPCSLIAKLTGR